MDNAFYNQDASIHSTPEAQLHIVPPANGHLDEPFPENTATDAEKLLALYHEIAEGVPDAVFVLSTVNPPKVKGATAPLISQRFRIGNVEGMAAEARARSEHSNVYFGPALMRRDLPTGQRGKEQDIVAVLSVIIEEDKDTGKLVKLPPGISPTFEVMTSSDPALNKQFHFLHEKPLPPTEAKALAELAYRKCGGDHGGKDITHVWRLPATQNFPCWRKIERGRPEAPQPVELIGGTGKPVNVDALRAALESMPDRHPAHEPTPGAEWHGGGSEDRDEVMTRLHPALRVKIEEEGEDRSAHCFSVMMSLFDAGLTDDEVRLVADGAPFAAKYQERLDSEIARARSKWNSQKKSPFSEDPLPLYREIEKGEAFPIEALARSWGVWQKR